MGLLGKLKAVGSGIKDVAESYAEYTAIGAKDMLPTAGTAKGAAHGDLGDIAKIGVAAAVVGSSVLGAGRLVKGATTLRAGAGDLKLAQGIARTPLQFPNIASERSLAGRIKNVMNDKIAADRAAAAFTAQRNAELPGKIAAVKQEITRIESLGSRSAQAAGGKTGNISRITQKLKGGEEGSMRLPGRRVQPEKVASAHVAADVEAAHANVPQGMKLTTSQSSKASATGTFNRFTDSRLNKTLGSTGVMHPDSLIRGPGEATASEELANRAFQDVKSGRAKLAGFYEKIKSEKGWIRMQKSGPYTTDIHFGEGVFAKVPQAPTGLTKLGKDIMAPANYYRMQVGRAGKANVLSVNWLQREGKPGNVQKELSALGKNAKARGINKVTFEPLSSINAVGRDSRVSGSNARERLFKGMASKLGLKAESKGTVNVFRNREIPAPTALPGTGGSDTGTSRIAVALRQMRSERGSLTLGSADKEAALTKRFGVKPTKGELKSRAYAARNYGFGESARPEMKTIMGKHLSLLDALKTHPARLNKN